MKRLIVFAACLLLATAACKKSTDAPAAGEPTAQPAATAPAGGPAAAEAPAAEPKPVVFTDDMVQKYMQYQKENIATWREYGEQMRKNLESSKDSTVKTLNQIAVADKYGKEIEAKMEARRQALGLSQEEFDALKEAVGSLATSRALYNQMGGDAQMAKMEAEQKAQVAKLPADQRAAAEAQMAEFSKGLKDMRDGAEIRKKYGDKNADVLMKYADALAAQWTEAIKESGKK